MNVNRQDQTVLKKSIGTWFALNNGKWKSIPKTI